MYNRKPTRLKNYDYSQNGYYFITICTKNKMNFFGSIQSEKMILNKYGEIVYKHWYDLDNYYLNCVLDEFIIMPNHVHGIIQITENKSKLYHGKKHNLSEIIRGFKAFSSKAINVQLDKSDLKFQWQKSFFDRVIRNENELYKIREYIINNPLKWELDKENIHRNNRPHK